MNTSKPRRYLLVQSQKWKHQNKIWNLFKVTNKDTRTTCLYCFLWTNVTDFAVGSNVEFQQLNACWNITRQSHIALVTVLLTLKSYLLTRSSLTARQKMAFKKMLIWNLTPSVSLQFVSWNGKIELWKIVKSQFVFKLYQIYGLLEGGSWFGRYRRYKNMRCSISFLKQMIEIVQRVWLNQLNVTG